MTYFCIVNNIGINRNNRDKWSYPDLPSASGPVRTRILFFRELPQISEDESCMSDIAKRKERGGNGSDFQTSSHSECFDQNKMSDLIRDLNPSKKSSE
jgi:hypothetical protein